MRDVKVELAHTYIALMVLIAAYANAAFSESLDKRDRRFTKTYYIDPSASKNGDGTVAHPFNSWAYLSIQAGDTYLQKAGTVYRGTIDIHDLVANPVGTFIGRYGNGSAPQINLFSNVDSWTLVFEYVYLSRINWTGGEVEQDHKPFRFIPWNGSVQSTFPASANGIYTFDPYQRTLYLLASGSPPGRHNIQVAHGDFGITIRNSVNVTVSGLEITGASRHGILVSSSQNVTLTHLSIHDVGGQWDGSNRAYLGNGIEFADGSSNGAVKDSQIWDIFDSGVTAQLYDPTKPNASGFVFNGNQIYRNGFAAVELAGIAPAVTVSGVTISDNAIHDNGMGWSGDRGGKGHGIYEWTTFGSNSAIKNVMISGNHIYSNAGTGVDADQAHGDITLKHNIIDHNQHNGVFLSDYQTRNGDRYIIDENHIIFNVDSGVQLNNWGSSGFSFTMNTVADNGIHGDGNFVTDGVGSGINISHNIFTSHYGPAATALYNYWAGGNVDYNTYTGLASSVLSAEHQIYDLEHVGVYQGLTAQDIHSSFSGS